MPAGEFRRMHLPYTGSSAGGGASFSVEPREYRYKYVLDTTVNRIRIASFKDLKLFIVGLTKG